MLEFDAEKLKTMAKLKETADKWGYANHLLVHMLNVGELVGVVDELAKNQVKIIRLLNGKSPKVD